MSVSDNSVASQHHFIFIGGLHRSGTTALRQIVQSHPLVSGFCNTGVDEDEGQFLQDIYPTDAHFGGPGIFGLHSDAHMAEDSPLLPAAKATLFQKWSPYWDLSKPFLVEKTPGNLIRSRFLQEIFPNSTFVFITRHPVACALATLKWQNRVSISRIIKHWVNCHNILLDDQFYLKRKILLRYEDLCEDPQTTMINLANYIGISPDMSVDLLIKNLNDRYLTEWKRGNYRLWCGKDHWKAPLQRWRNLAENAYIGKKYEREINSFGYSFKIDSEAESGLIPPQDIGDYLLSGPLSSRGVTHVKASVS
jgi:hypothetical protein